MANIYEYLTKHSLEANTAGSIGFERIDLGAQQLSTTSLILYDTSKPLATEGIEVLSITYTPKILGSKIIVRSAVSGRPPSNGIVTNCICSDKETYAISTATERDSNSIMISTVHNSAVIDVDSLETITISMRAGSNVAGTLHINGHTDGAVRYGDSWNNFLEIEEVMVGDANVALESNEAPYPKVGEETLLSKRHPVSGKPVYTKAYRIADTGTTYDGTIAIADIASTLEDIYVVDYVLKTTNGYTMTSANSNNASDTAQQYIRINPTPAIEYYLSDTVSYQNVDLTVTVEYTKTDDIADSPIAKIYHSPVVAPVNPQNEYVGVDADITAESFKIYLCMTSLGSHTVTLPANPNPNETVRIVDSEANAGTNNITVARNGTNIMGFDEDMLIDADNMAITLAYLDASKGWMVA